MLLHVDNLRRSYEREHTELEETKRVLIEHKLLVVRTFIFFVFFFHHRAQPAYGENF